MTLRGRVLLVESLGAEQLIHLEVPAIPLGRPELVDAAAQPPGPAFGTADAAHSTTILGRFDRSSLLRSGEAAEVSVDPRRLHFFDLETGAALQATDAPVAAELAS
jgi:multiple sugar transport system ATP-binding protein